MLQFKSFLYEIILKIKDVKFEVYIYTYYYLKVKFSQTLHIASTTCMSAALMNKKCNFS